MKFNNIIYLLMLHQLYKTIDGLEYIAFRKEAKNSSSPSMQYEESKLSERTLQFDSKLRRNSPPERSTIQNTNIINLNTDSSRLIYDQLPMESAINPILKHYSNPLSSTNNYMNDHVQVFPPQQLTTIPFVNNEPLLSGSVVKDYQIVPLSMVNSFQQTPSENISYLKGLPYYTPGYPLYGNPVFMKPNTFGYPLMVDQRVPTIPLNSEQLLSVHTPVHTPKIIKNNYSANNQGNDKDEYISYESERYLSESDTTESPLTISEITSPSTNASDVSNITLKSQSKTTPSITAEASFLSELLAFEENKNKHKRKSLSDLIAGKNLNKNIEKEKNVKNTSKNITADKINTQTESFMKNTSLITQFLKQEEEKNKHKRRALSDILTSGTSIYAVNENIGPVKKSNKDREHTNADYMSEKQNPLLKVSTTQTNGPGYLSFVSEKNVRQQPDFTGGHSRYVPYDVNQAELGKMLKLFDFLDEKSLLSVPKNSLTSYSNILSAQDRYLNEYISKDQDLESSNIPAVDLEGIHSFEGTLSSKESRIAQLNNASSEYEYYYDYPDESYEDYDEFYQLSPKDDNLNANSFNTKSEEKSSGGDEEYEEYDDYLPIEDISKNHLGLVNDGVKENLTPALEGRNDPSLKNNFQNVSTQHELSSLKISNQMKSHILNTNLNNTNNNNHKQTESKFQLESISDTKSNVDQSKYQNNNTLKESLHLKSNKYESNNEKPQVTSTGIVSPHDEKHLNEYEYADDDDLWKEFMEHMSSSDNTTHQSGLKGVKDPSVEKDLEKGKDIKTLGDLKMPDKIHQNETNNDTNSTKSSTKKEFLLSNRKNVKIKTDPIYQFTGNSSLDDIKNKKSSKNINSDSATIIETKKKKGVSSVREKFLERIKNLKRDRVPKFEDTNSQISFTTPETLTLTEAISDSSPSESSVPTQSVKSFKLIGDDPFENRPASIADRVEIYRRNNALRESLLKNFGKKNEGKNNTLGSSTSINYNTTNIINNKTKTESQKRNENEPVSLKKPEILNKKMMKDNFKNKTNLKKFEKATEKALDIQKSKFPPSYIMNSPTDLIISGLGMHLPLENDKALINTRTSFRDDILFNHKDYLLEGFGEVKNKLKDFKSILKYIHTKRDAMLSQTEKKNKRSLFSENEKFIDKNVTNILKEFSSLTENASDPSIVNISKKYTIQYTKDAPVIKIDSRKVSLSPFKVENIVFKDEVLNKDFNDTRNYSLHRTKRNATVLESVKNITNKQNDTKLEKTDIGKMIAKVFENNSSWKPMLKTTSLMINETTKENRTLLKENFSSLFNVSVSLNVTGNKSSEANASKSVTTNVKDKELLQSQLFNKNKTTSNTTANLEKELKVTDDISITIKNKTKLQFSGEEPTSNKTQKSVDLSKKKKATYVRAPPIKTISDSKLSDKNTPLKTLSENKFSDKNTPLKTLSDSKFSDKTTPLKTLSDSKFSDNNTPLKTFSDNKFSDKNTTLGSQSEKEKAVNKILTLNKSHQSSVVVKEKKAVKKDETDDKINIGKPINITTLEAIPDVTKQLKSLLLLKTGIHTKQREDINVDNATVHSKNVSNEVVRERIRLLRLLKKHKTSLENDFHTKKSNLSYLRINSPVTLRQILNGEVQVGNEEKEELKNIVDLASEGEDDKLEENEHFGKKTEQPNENDFSSHSSSRKPSKPTAMGHTISKAERLENLRKYLKIYEYCISSNVNPLHSTSDKREALNYICNYIKEKASKRAQKQKSVEDYDIHEDYEDKNYDYNDNHGKSYLDNYDDYNDYDRPQSPSRGQKRYRNNNQSENVYKEHHDGTRVSSLLYPYFNESSVLKSGNIVQKNNIQRLRKSMQKQGKGFRRSRENPVFFGILVNEDSVTPSSLSSIIKSNVRGENQDESYSESLKLVSSPIARNFPRDSYEDLKSVKRGHQSKKDEESLHILYENRENTYGKKIKKNREENSEEGGKETLNYLSSLSTSSDNESKSDKKKSLNSRLLLQLYREYVKNKGKTQNNENPPTIETQNHNIVGHQEQTQGSWNINEKLTLNKDSPYLNRSVANSYRQSDFKNQYQRELENIYKGSKSSTEHQEKNSPHSGIYRNVSPIVSSEYYNNNLNKNEENPRSFVLKKVYSVNPNIYESGSSNINIPTHDHTYEQTKPQNWANDDQRHKGSNMYRVKSNEDSFSRNGYDDYYGRFYIPSNPQNDMEVKNYEYSSIFYDEDARRGFRDKRKLTNMDYFDPGKRVRSYTLNSGELNNMETNLKRAESNNIPFLRKLNENNETTSFIPLIPNAKYVIRNYSNPLQILRVIAERYKQMNSSLDSGSKERKSFEKRIGDSFIPSDKHSGEETKFLTKKSSFLSNRDKGFSRSEWIPIPSEMKQTKETKQKNAQILNSESLSREFRFEDNGGSFAVGKGRKTNGQNERDFQSEEKNYFSHNFEHKIGNEQRVKRIPYSSFVKIRSNLPVDGDKDGVPGISGTHYPDIKIVPKTSFNCFNKKDSNYPDPETGCQVYYECKRSEKKKSFICPSGTIFDYRTSRCEWWYDATCKT